MRRKLGIALATVIGSLLVMFLLAPGCVRVETPIVDTDGPWTDTVKKGPMILDVRGAGTLIHGRHAAKPIARVTVFEPKEHTLRLNQRAQVDMRIGIMPGHVSRISDLASNRSRSVDITIDATVPERLAADAQVDATIYIAKLKNVLYVGRPVHADANSTMRVFKLVDDGAEADRVIVKFGRAAVNIIQVMGGLKEGDRIVLSDVSDWDNFDRIRVR
jgi:hypothetical protein